MLEIVVWVILIGALIGASVTDIKTREVPDWINFSLIGVGIALGLIMSLHTLQWLPFLEHLLGLAVGIILGLALFYTGQWGGGDSKLLMGIGALLGFPLTWINSFTGFLVNLIIVGSVYGIGWTLVLFFTHRKKATRKAGYLRKKYIIVEQVLHSLAFVGIILILIVDDLFLKVMFGMVIGLCYLSWILYLMSTAVEQTALLQWRKPHAVTEGDWIAKNISVNNRLIVGPRSLGISNKQLRVIKKLEREHTLNKVLVKVGIPFVPSFLGAAVCSLIWGNLLLVLI